jgi:hypothetical protein
MASAGGRPLWLVGSSFGSTQLTSPNQNQTDHILSSSTQPTQLNPTPTKPPTPTQNQVRLAAGATLGELGLVQEKIKTSGYAMQCRVSG